MKTLPDPFLDPEMECVPETAPGPEFEFESPRELLSSLHVIALSLNLQIGRTPFL